jgi:hypothetical protein
MRTFPLHGATGKPPLSFLVGSSFRAAISRAGLQSQDGRSWISSWLNLNVWPRDRRATRC